MILRFVRLPKARFPRTVRVDALHTLKPKGELFDKIIIANRGEIACRVMRTARRLGVKTVAIYSDVDAGAMHVAMADEAYRVGPAVASESYLNSAAVLDIAKRSGAQALHPGYGFLSESAEFAQACAAAGVNFIGPPPEAIKAMGSKSIAKRMMAEAGVPITPGYHGDDQTDDRLAKEAEAVGYPLMIKPVMGGGGKGMRVVRQTKDFMPALEACRREASKAFGKTAVLLERYVDAPRHVEVQVFADKRGNAVYLFERDCSVQRRHQKVIEEAPAPGLSSSLRQELGQAAVRAALAVGYEGAGTVEFLLDTTDDRYYFCEMNTRLQVEHPVTEMITGQDLVEWQLRVAAGEPLPIAEQALVQMRGHALEARIYAENTARGFLPATGRLTHLRTPEPVAGHLRVETGVREGDSVSMFYDPMIAKLVVWAPDRTQAIARLVAAIRQYQVLGVPTNLDFCERVLRHPAFAKGGVTTKFLDSHGEDLAAQANAQPAPQAVALAVLGLVLRQGTPTYETTAAAGTGKVRNHSPWSTAMGPWRGVVPRQVKIHWKLAAQDRQDGPEGSMGLATVICHHDGSHTVTCCGSTFVVNGRLDQSGTLSAIIDGRRYAASVLRDEALAGGLLMNLWQTAGPLDGSASWAHRYQMEIQGQPAAHTQVLGSGPLKVLSPMPGRVIQVLAAEGDVVERGRPLVIIEAMKMEHTVVAPSASKLGSVFVVPGSVVDEGSTLMALEAA